MTVANTKVFMDKSSIIIIKMYTKQERIEAEHRKERQENEGCSLQPSIC